VSSTQLTQHSGSDFYWPYNCTCSGAAEGLEGCIPPDLLTTQSPLTTTPSPTTHSPQSTVRKDPTTEESLTTGSTLHNDLTTNNLITTVSTEREILTTGNTVITTGSAGSQDLTTEDLLTTKAMEERTQSSYFELSSTKTRLLTSWPSTAVSSLTTEQLTAATDSYGDIEWDTWTDWTQCHQRNKETVRLRFQICSLSTSLSAHCNKKLFTPVDVANNTSIPYIGRCAVFYFYSN
jgi:hypothetical protein